MMGLESGPGKLLMFGIRKIAQNRPQIDGGGHVMSQNCKFRLYNEKPSTFAHWVALR